jgi:predicted acetyltransferase
VALLTQSPRPLALRVPGRDLLPAYARALAGGWSPDSAQDVSAAQLRAIAADPDAFLDKLRHSRGRIRLDDGSLVPRLPGFVRWMDDGEVCGSINFRHQPGTEELPAYCSGHVGYSVAPWKRRRGIATAALALMLDEIRAAGTGLRRVRITCDADNDASRRVIERNGGERKADEPPMRPGGKTKLAYWISL